MNYYYEYSEWVGIGFTGLLLLIAICHQLWRHIAIVRKSVRWIYYELPSYIVMAIIAGCIMAIVFPLGGYVIMTLIVAIVNVITLISTGNFYLQGKELVDFLNKFLYPLFCIGIFIGIALGIIFSLPHQTNQNKNTNKYW